MAEFNDNLPILKQWMETLTKPTLYRIDWVLKQMNFENISQMDQLLQVIYDAATGCSSPQRHLYAEVCDLLKQKSVNETTFKNLLLKKCQTSFKLVMDGDVVDTSVVEFIGELFNVGLFPGTILTKQLIDELINRRMQENHESGLLQVYALLVTAGSRLEAEIDHSPQRYSFTMQQYLWRLEEAAMKQTAHSKGSQRGNSVELVGELNSARKKKWIPFMEATRMKRLTEQKYQQITRQELLEYNNKVDGMFERLKLSFGSKTLQQAS